MTKWAAMCKITGEEMWWIRMDPSYTELGYSLKIDGYWKFQRYQYAVQVMGWAGPQRRGAGASSSDYLKLYRATSSRVFCIVGRHNNSARCYNLLSRSVCTCCKTYAQNVACARKNPLHCLNKLTHQHDKRRSSKKLI